MAARRRWGSAGLWAGTLLVAALAAPLEGSPGPDRAEVARQQLAAKKRAMRAEMATAHVKLGIVCRDMGLVPQASAEFIRAVEVGDGANAWAERVLALMRSLDDRFWKKVNRHPQKATLAGYEKRAKRLEDDLLEARYALAKETTSKGLAEESYREWTELVREVDRPLKVDAQEQVVLPLGAVPPDVSRRIVEAAITINGQRYVRDAFLELVPDLKEVREAVGERVRVRLQGGAQAPEDLLASLEALFAFLEEDMGGRPNQRMTLFVFQDRPSFQRWLTAAEIPGFSVASGLADGATRTAIVCAEGAPLESIRGMAMHEIAHLFHYGVSPAVMPSWYAEGFAETFGGSGTWTWKDGTLTLGGTMDRARLAAIASPDGYLPLSQLLVGDALDLITKDRGMAHRFYAESWAFLRFMRAECGAEQRERFRLWEIACRGKATGAQAGKPRNHDGTAAATDFSKVFQADLPALETAFKAWLAKQ